MGFARSLSNKTMGKDNKTIIETYLEAIAKAILLKGVIKPTAPESPRSRGCL
jgi:hypothetical protein